MARQKMNDQDLRNAVSQLDEILGQYQNATTDPKVGDIVEWASNGERWTVTAEDLSGPTSIAEWPRESGRWRNVILIKRSSNKRSAPEFENEQ